MDFRYSSSVVAPIHCMVPRASAGLRILAASIEPGAEPAPTKVCISSMNTITCGLFSNSRISALILSSNWPLYLVPATIPAKSRLTMRLLNKRGEVRFLAINCANPSTIALFPTPGSPMRMGLFFFLLPRISTTLFISFSRPTMGSNFPSVAALLKSIPKLSSTGVLLLFGRSLFVAAPVAAPDEEYFPPFWLGAFSSKSLSGSPIPLFILLLCISEFFINS